MSDKKPTVSYFASVPEDSLRKSHDEIIEMLRGQIEAGNVQSLIVIFAGDKEGEQATYGGRHLIRARHMDFLDDVFRDAMSQVTDETGCTAQKMREARAEAFERMRKESGQ
jgi:hypothetical protein